MFKIIFVKELKDIIQSSRFTISFAVCSVLIILSFFMGTQNYLASQAQYEAAYQENRNQIAANTEWIMVRHTIMLPPQPLMALVNGISNDIGRNIEMSGRGELRSDDTRFNDEPLFAIFRFMDLEFIFGIVLSLFAIIFAYDAINGEKASGTLKLCFSNSVSRASFIAGKLAGSFVGLSVALMIPMLIGCAMLPLMGVELTPDEWIRLGLILLAGLAYFGLFLALAMGISAMTARPSNSFLFGLVIWIFAVLIVPRASVLISGRLVEVPNVDDITAQKNRYRTQLFEEDRPKMSHFQPTSSEPQEVMKEFSAMMGDLSNTRQQKMEAFTERINEEYVNSRIRQEEIALALSRISPTSVFTLASTELAGTSLGLQNRFMTSAKDYQNLYGNFMSEKTGQNGVGGFRMVMISTDDDQEEKATLDPDEMPQFELAKTTVASAAGKSMLDLGLLVLFNILFFGGAFAAFLRYDLR